MGAHREGGDRSDAPVNPSTPRPRIPWSQRDSGPRRERDPSEYDSVSEHALRRGRARRRLEDWREARALGVPVEDLLCD